MFSKQHTTLPLVMDIQVGPDTVLADARLHDDTHAETIARSYDWLQVFQERHRPGGLICANSAPAVQQAYMEDFARWLKRHPGKTSDDFDRVYDPGWDDSTLDVRKPVVQFVVNVMGRQVGVFGLYNIDIEDAAARKVVVSAMPVPAIPDRNGDMDVPRVRAIMRVLLETDRLMGDGRMLDIIEWRLPTRDTHVWPIPSDRYGAGPVMKDLADHHDLTTELRAGKVVPLKIRRR